MNKHAFCLAAARLAVAVASVALPSSGLAGDIVGVHKVTLVAGRNFLSTPLHPKSLFAGTLSGRTADSVTFAANPNWAVNQFAPVSGRPQFIVIVKSDASGSPGVEGDWWHVTANTDKSITVNNKGTSLLGHLAAGDTLELRRLTSLKDLFGSGAGTVLNKDSNGEVLTTEEDVVTLVQGTSFVGDIFYHDGSLAGDGFPEGYYDADGNHAGDGSTLTLNPGQPVLVQRKQGSAPRTIAFTGYVHQGRFTQYLNAGPNAIGPVFPVPASIGASQLKESGFVSDTNGEVLTTEDSVAYLMNGSFFGTQLFHYAGPDADQGWYVDGEFNNAAPIEPTRAYTVFQKGPGALVWRQPSPFVP
jgi:uncharacterized protein (TIGR02597 family)